MTVVICYTLQIASASNAVVKLIYVPAPEYRARKQRSTLVFVCVPPGYSPLMSAPMRSIPTNMLFISLRGRLAVLQPDFASTFV